MASTRTDATSPPPTPPAGTNGTEPARQSRWITATWCAHWLLRMFVAGYFFIYGWSKLFLLQMGTIDYPESLITVGEKSPMGILWTWMGYSPTIQFAAGAIEVLVGLLLLWRRTAALGALGGVAAGFSVWLLNMTYDVPVKTLSGMLAVLSAVILIPWIPRVFRFLTGAPVDRAVLPNAVTPEKLRRVTRFFPALAAILAIALPFATQSMVLPGSDSEDEPTPLAGVWRVSTDSRGPAETLAEDSRWSQIAFGTREASGPATSTADSEQESRIVAVREVDGTLWLGTYALRGEPGADAEATVDVTLDAQLGGNTTLGRAANDGGDPQPHDGDVIEESFTVSVGGDELKLGGERTLHATRDTEGEYLFDKGFSWSGDPVNR
ncbi:MAG TPA: DoxX family protein [Dietzia timorensis]|uniref:DoxX family protein n=1 Tax=Dietzia timorensis TaxID=499555 RepID=A0A921JZ14_9ACTN|nr:DoxX family protein [Dietzia timorensis]HJE90471.1 DoxX family protein [Dietzia timorensis]